MGSEMCIRDREGEKGRERSWGRRPAGAPLKVPRTAQEPADPVSQPKQVSSCCARRKLAPGIEGHTHAPPRGPARSALRSKRTLFRAAHTHAALEGTLHSKRTLFFSTHTSLPSSPPSSQSASSLVIITITTFLYLIYMLNATRGHGGAPAV